MSYSDYIYYVGDEIKYGTKLYISGWKKLLFHPWQLVKDTANAILHPIETIKNVLNEIKHHSIGMTVNIGLSWITGRAITAGVKYLRTAPLQTPQFIGESPFSSVFSQAAQVGSQMLGGGCCGGICTTTAGRIGQTTSLITSQSESSTKHRLTIKDKNEQEISKNYSPYYNSVKAIKQEKKCNDISCSTKQNSLETCKGKLKNE